MEMRKMILTAGPSITQKEIDYVVDAVKNGWNENWDSYLKRFEEAFASFIGVKYALATSSCTGAMHLALLALGIKDGDEVIIPDLAWVATANVVKYTGAEPVLVDVLEDTWCLNPESIKKAITKKTRVIMPVHLYGHPCEMDEINSIAKKYGLYVVEDAAQSIGSLYNDKRPGSLGDIGCFSFQGAKIMVTGEGGMLITNNEELYERAKFYNNHGRDPKGSFWIYEVGYKYKMSNLQAALGLAQLERIDELVEKKRLIYKWYKERLEDIEGIKLNVEKNNVKNNYWMTSIVLNGKFSVGRDELMKRLKEEFQIDTRTFYYPISEFKPFNKRFENPTSMELARQGINLPSGHNLKVEEINWITQSIKKILQGK
ncbi:MAG: DegT/DnrJ/EryC1/StrS family aminotransferase [Candidatus Odinarchaeia archaeon]